MYHSGNKVVEIPSGVMDMELCDGNYVFPIFSLPGGAGEDDSLWVVCVCKWMRDPVRVLGEPRVGALI